MIDKVVPFLKVRLRQITPIQAFILLIVVFATVFVVKFYGRSPQEQIIKVQVVGRDWTQSFASFEGFRAPYWLVDKIQEGATEVSQDGGKIAEIIKVEKYERVTPDFEIYLTIKLRGEENTRTGQFKYRERIIEIGKPVTFHFDGIEIVGQVIDDQVPPGGYPRKETQVTVRVRNAEPWLVTKVKIGSTITDSPGGEVIAEITGIRIEPASNTFYTGITRSGGTFIERTDRARDLVMTVRMRVEGHNNLLYFAGFQNVKVGNTINLFFPEVNLFRVEIQDVKEIKP